MTTIRLLVFVTAATCASAASRPDMLVATDWLANHLNDPKVVILHVAGNRTAYDAGHIPGARFVAQSELAVAREGVPNELPDVSALKKVLESAGVSDDSRIILYSDTSVLPATRAYFTLDYLGHGDHAALLDGGLNKWRSESRALSNEVPATQQGRLTPRLKPEVVAKMDAVKEMPARKSEVLLDARVPAEYGGEKGSHIPGALNLPSLENQTSRENHTLKSEADLRKLYEAVGITPGSKVVTYCNTGMQATESYFALKYLGYDVKLYDGSMSEWTQKGAPVENTGPSK